MDFFVTPAPCVGVSLVREGTLISISYIYDVEEAFHPVRAAVELYDIAAQIAALMDVPLILEAGDGY